MEFEKIRGVVAEQLNIAPEKITEATRFTEDLHADSLDLFQIICALEEVYGITFADEDAPGIATVGDAAAYVAKALAE